MAQSGTDEKQGLLAQICLGANEKRRDMIDRQVIEALRTKSERLWQIAIKARRAAAMAEREYRVALGEALEGLIAEYNELAEAEVKGERWQLTMQQDGMRLNILTHAKS